MRLTQYLLTYFACAAMLTFIFASSVTAQATDTSSSEKKAAVSITKWEYCILNYQESENGRLYIVVRYLRANGVQKEKFEYPKGINYESQVSAYLDLIMTIMAKLGDDGWELAGEDRMILGNANNAKFIFKRPKH
jgi:hypothetical protein